MTTTTAAQRRTASTLLLLASLCLLSLLPWGQAFQLPCVVARRRGLASTNGDNNDFNSPKRKTATESVGSQTIPPTAAMALATAILATTTATTPTAALAYNPNDYASDTVLNTVQLLKNAQGNVEQTFKAYETLADIITEGTGVGGQINYKGVQLDRGYVADEDTAIYNPGLTLLTESEKERLLEAVIASRSAGLTTSQWSDDNEFGFQFLRERLDPLHMNELKGFLGILPFYGAVVYLLVLGVQQFLRPLFGAAYLVGVAAVFGPALVLILTGP